jgi:hypothetical protein
VHMSYAMVIILVMYTVHMSYAMVIILVMYSCAHVLCS